MWTKKRRRKDEEKERKEKEKEKEKEKVSRSSTGRSVVHRRSVGRSVGRSIDRSVGRPVVPCALEAPILVIYVFFFIDAREHLSRILRGSLASGGPISRNLRDFIDMREQFSRILRGVQALRSEKHRKIQANWLLQGFFNLS